MKTTRLLLSATLSLTLLGIAEPVCRAAETYHFLKEIAVGGEGGWDWMAVDESARRLYATHATKVVVVDTDKDVVVGEIADTPGPHGFAIAPDLQLGFSANGKENKASIIDLKTLKTLSKVDTGENPDAILYEPGRQEVYVFNGKAHSATVFEAKGGNMVATIALPGKPEFAVTDTKAERVYCNIEDKSVVVAINTKIHEIAETWPIAPGEEASGLAIDTANHRLFLGCGNKMMVMMDSVTGKVIANVPIGDGVDANMFDPGTQLAFSSNGEGNVTIAHEETPDKLTVIQTLTTEHGARTMAVDPKTHKIYLSNAKFEPAPAATAENPKPRPKMIPSTYKILVYGPGK